MNEDMISAIAEADSWVMHPLLFNIFSGFVEERIACELPFESLLSFQRQGVNVRVDQFLPDNIVALLRGMNVIGLIRFEQGEMVFVKFKDCPVLWSKTPFFSEQRS